ncbi:MAG TPA: OmpA family protein [Labilithrix sp.]
MVFLFAGAARAEGVRVHVEGFGAHAVGTPQGSELGTGGGGAGTIEVPFGPIGAQAGAGAMALAQGSAPTDSSVAQRSVGTAMFGTAGVRLHPFGMGPWADANAGVAQTGSLVRPAFDAHLGWDFAVSRGFALGPCVGYMQIVQPEDSLRPDDARILTAGLSLTFGGAPRSTPAPEPRVEEPPPPPEDQDGLVEVDETCPADMVVLPDGECAPKVELVDDHIEIGDVIHFAFNSPLILGESEKLVQRVAELIEAHPEIAELRIEGHADARGTEAYNMALSQARAASTREMLVHFGVQRSKLAVAAYGKSRLVIATPLPDRRNRRVEFIVVKTSGGAL